MTRAAYAALIEEDIAWLLQQPRTLEREHILLILQRQPTDQYGPPPSDEGQGDDD
jgi:hypothetical protein